MIGRFRHGDAAVGRGLDEEPRGKGGHRRLSSAPLLHQRLEPFLIEHSAKRIPEVGRVVSRLVFCLRFFLWKRGFILYGRYALA